MSQSSRCIAEGSEIMTLIEYYEAQYSVQYNVMLLGI